MNKVVKHEGGSLMVWGCITWNGPGQLWHVNKTLDAKQFCQILDSALIGTLEDYKQNTTSIIFQQDNDPKHKSARVQHWFEEKKIQVLPWPLSSPNMNVIKHNDMF